uniref:Bifunctional glutamine synthetase adenylyltransferase/adenylyl-removing enzyme n=1 Tax=Candidatus Kentrum sp. MB TaxID=2138164 RepID=A0A451B810_9GAMM|nr:MAG: glutamate-ammonia-ligase adenylyltransferase [Candidatus Kentron sp. MB]VFK27841.1 MAG: glutamate-ammonia-ligase adenylyltransferase [Candidatus Kentron sp. MB]VFK74438.1 MAG: glutamate-ammonia-ligase adenylyltransferase [Candidatus Kentron sp. MB]
MLQAILDLPLDTLRVWACSDFVVNTCARAPALVVDLLETGDLARGYPSDHYRLQARRMVASVSSEEELLATLRWLRRREMIRIAWRDVGGIATLDETVRDLSGFADAVIDAALERLHTWACEKFGTPQSATGQPQRLIVLAMGKLGARELNFSSDVDLIFVFPEVGETAREGASGKRALSNHEFFTRLGRQLIKVLGESTADGLVFRVDMRLRPFGASGPLVVSSDALEDYYQIHGRDWERYALIRARAIAGDIAAGNDLLKRLRPFIYRRYLDFGAIESLREMKALITREIQHKGYEENVKLGPGGIREIEFLAQMFQIIHGGQESDLRERRVVTVIERLGERGYLPESAVLELSRAYGFLRTVEHRLQEVDDRQTHQIPEDAWERERLAAGLGLDRWTTLSPLLQQHRDNVTRHFTRIFAESDSVENTANDAAANDAATDLRSDPEHDLAMLIAGGIDENQGAEILKQAGFPDGIRVWTMLHALRNDTKLRFLAERGQGRLERLLPLVLQSVLERDGSLITLARVFQILEAIGRRSVYFSLLRENPVALEELTRLCAASPWIASQIAHYPLLLDGLLRPRLLYAPATVSELEADLENRLGQVAKGDGEQEMEALRRFKQANVLRVAAADVSGAMPLMVVSDHLTDIAEVCLRQVLRLVWRDLVERYGKPQCAHSGDIEEASFLIIAYGKLGGIELGYGSDLDLVFLHNSHGTGQCTDGPKKIDNSVFFGRLAQRIVHLLGARTPTGILYEVDTRLRPSGQSGSFVTSIDAFADYQRQDAWIWEHQALVRARVVAGDAALAEHFQTIRQAILCMARDPDKLRREVAKMRHRMREELDHPPRGFFHLKQGVGGITDIEFIVQFATLRWADRLADYLVYSDNVRLLEGLAETGLMEKNEAQSLTDAYRRYRSQVHVLALQEQPPLAPETAFTEERNRVIAIWRQLITEEV